MDFNMSKVDGFILVGPSFVYQQEDEGSLQALYNQGHLTSIITDKISTEMVWDEQDYKPTNNCSACAQTPSRVSEKLQVMTSEAVWQNEECVKLLSKQKV